MTEEDKLLLEYAKAQLKIAGRVNPKRLKLSLAEFWYDVEVTINYAKGF